MSSALGDDQFLDLVGLSPQKKGGSKARELDLRKKDLGDADFLSILGMGEKLERKIDVGEGLQNVEFGDALETLNKTTSEILAKAISRGRNSSLGFAEATAAEQMALLSDVGSIGEVGNELRSIVSQGRDEDEKLNILSKQAKDRGSVVVPIKNKKGKVINHLIVDSEGNKKLFDFSEKNAKDVLDFMGDFVETAPGVLGAVVGGVPGGALGDALGTYLRASAAKGSGAGDSDAIEEIGRGALNVVLGLFGEFLPPAAKRAAGTVFKGVGKRTLAKSAARSVAGAGENLSEIGGQKTVRSFFQESEELERRLSQSIGEEFKFTPGQATGELSVLAAEKRLSKRGATRAAFALNKLKQTKQAAKSLDSITNRLASNPGALGRKETAERFASGVSDYVEGVQSATRTAAKPFYEAAENAGIRAQPTDTINTVRRLIQENEAIPELTSKLRQDLKFIESKGGKLSPSQFQSLRSKWLERLRGETRILESIGKRKQRRIAAQYLNAIENDLTSAENLPIAGEAIRSLRKGNAIWREGIEEIQGTVTKSVDKLVKALTGDTGDAALEKISRMSPNQIQGVVRAAEKTSPESAAQLRAEVFDFILEKAGKPVTTRESIATDVGARQLNPKKLLSKLSDPGTEDRIRALFGGKPKELMAFKDSMQMMQRLGDVGRLNTTGSESGPVKAVMRRVLKNVPGEGLLDTSLDAIRTLFAGRDAESAMKVALATPDGMDAFRQALRAEFEQRTKGSITERTAKNLFRAGIRIANSPELRTEALPSGDIGEIVLPESLQ